jgi:hypothetical protein
MRLECSNSAQIMCLMVKTMDRYILTGDLMRSMTLFAYKPAATTTTTTTTAVSTAAGAGTIEELSRDYNVCQMRAIDFANNNNDDNLFIGADNDQNLFVTRYNSNAGTEEERGRMENVGYFILGDNVNVFREGSLLHNNDNNNNNNNSIGTRTAAARIDALDDC